MGKKNNSRIFIEDWAAGCTSNKCVSDFISTVSTILHHDYRNLKCNQFDNIYAWDADRYENKMHGNQSSETVDMVLGIAYGKMLMVEAKLNVQNVDNIKGEVEAKINHTRQYIVSSINFKSIVKPSIVLFDQKNFHSLYNRFRRLNNYKTNIEPMTLSTFYMKYFESA